MKISNKSTKHLIIDSLFISSIISKLKEENSNRLPSESPINQPSADVLPSLNIPTVNEEISQPTESPTITIQLQDSKVITIQDIICQYLKLTNICYLDAFKLIKHSL